MASLATLSAAAGHASTAAGRAEELIRAHLPLVGHLVRELAGRLPAHVSRDELTSAGMLALVTSAQGFDASRGVPFGRFAAIRIRGALTDELRSMDWASRKVRNRSREVESARQQLTAALSRAPRREEVAHLMGVPVGELDALEADVHRAAMLSVEGLHEAGGTAHLSSQHDGPEAVLVRREQVGLLHDAIAELPERLRTVVTEYFYGQRRMAEIAADLGVTESRVSQLRSEALTLLREGLHGQDAERGAASGAGAKGRAASAVRSRRPARGEAARESYVAAVAARSTLAARLAATTALGEIRSGLLGTRIAR